MLAMQAAGLENSAFSKVTRKRSRRFDPVPGDADRDEPGVGGIQNLDVRLQGGEEDRRALPHELRCRRERDLAV